MNIYIPDKDLFLPDKKELFLSGKHTEHVEELNAPDKVKTTTSQLQPAD